MTNVVILDVGVMCAVCYDSITPGSIGIGCSYCFQVASHYPAVIHIACWKRWEPGTCLLCRRLLYAEDIPGVVSFKDVVVCIIEQQCPFLLSVLPILCGLFALWIILMGPILLASFVSEAYKA